MSTLTPHPSKADPGIDAAVLAESVRQATNNEHAEPREGQALLSAAIARAFANYDLDSAIPQSSVQVAAQAPTGSGKALAALAPAVLAATVGRRTVLSTDSLALQAQVVNKDAPAAVEAVKKLTGKHVNVAVLKGWSNYVCLRTACDEAYAMLGKQNVTSLPTTPAALAKLGEKVAHTVSRTRFPLGDDTDPDVGRADAIAWALTLPRDQPTSTGERSAYEGPGVEHVDTLTMAREDCLDTKCPLYDMCYPVAARQLCADADILVTNHTMLGIQAATGAPVVIGNNKLGPIDHVVVDEAHSLAAKVRDAGAASLSNVTLERAARSLNSVFDRTLVESFAKDARGVGALLNAELTRLVQGNKADRVNVEGNPFGAIEGDLLGFVEHVLSKIPNPDTCMTALQLPARKARTRFNNLKDTIRTLAGDDPGYARWAHLVQPRVRPGHPPSDAYIEVACSPVAVGGLLNANLWTVKSEIETEADGFLDPRVPLAVVCMSATLPAGFAREVGLSTQPLACPSPFTDAYANSAVFVPSAIAPLDVEILAAPGTAMQQRPRFDTSRHPTWALPIMAKLLEANSGHALVLAATAAAGRLYAEHLTRTFQGQFRVFSQWDYSTAEAVVDHWRSDPTSVLIGTRSLMTGVDASGETCSLVVIDRVPRAAGNPVDDARARLLIDEAKYDKWTADALVYGGDAATLLAQAAGRLVRSETDSGMVAILDPRLHANRPGQPVRSRFTNSSTAQNLYRPILVEFGGAIAETDEAAAWLWRRRNKIEAAATQAS